MMDAWNAWRRMMSCMVEEPFSCGIAADTASEGGLRMPLVDIHEAGEKIAIDVEVPGVSKGDIELTISENALGISAKRSLEKESKTEGSLMEERSFSSFRRLLPLPVEVVPEKAQARFENGILHIEVPRAKATGKQIEIR